VEVKRTSRIGASALFIALSSPFLAAQSGHASYATAAHPGSPKRQDSFVDFALKRINPSDADYGERLTEGRNLLLEDGVERGYFWSNVIALGLLSCLFILIVFQHRIQAHREWTTAEIIAQLEQSLARSNAQVEEARKRNRALMESLAVLQPSTPPSQPFPADRVDGAPFRPTRSHAASSQWSSTTAPKGDGAKPAADHPAAAAAAPNPGGQIALFKPEVELVTRVNVLEQQLGRSHELEKHLRRQLNETGKKLQAEQERNRSLKGE
jgi:hypothetical protein